MKHLLLKTWVVMLCLLAGVGTTWAETKTEGFEAATAATDYQSTIEVDASKSDCSIAWKIYYGNVTTSNAITGSNSVGLRLYTSNNYGYLESKTAVANLSSISFDAKAATSNSAKIKFNVQTSTDGSSWTNVATDVAPGTTSTNYEYSVTSGHKFVKISISSNSTKPTKSSAQLTIDNFKFTYSNAGGSTPTALSVPTNLSSSNVTTTGATLSWDAVANASSYTVKVGTTEYTGVNTNSYNATGLTAGTQYTWTVKAVGDGISYSTSAYAANANFTTEAEQGGGEPSGDGTWTLCSISDLTSSDIFVIVDADSKKAMTNNNGTSSAPTAAAVTISQDGNTITGVTDVMKWNISGNASDGYTIYPNGSTTTWLYCTNSNNGVRVGTNTAKTFSLDGKYLKHAGTSRYVGVYDSSDWRCYTSKGGNIATTDTKFYKYVDNNAGNDDKTLVSIAASGTAADLWTADEFSHEGVTITATWDDETQTVVTSSCSFSGYDMTTAGTQTVTATYQGQTCTYSVTVNTIANTQETAYTTTQAIALIDAGKGLKEKVYVAGTVSKVDSYNSTYGSITYWLDENSFEIYGGLAQGGAKFSSKDDIQAEAEVVVFGVIKKYSATYEMDMNNVLVSYTTPIPKQTATISAPGAKTTMMIGDVDDEYTVSYDGDGALSVESSNSAVATVTIDGCEVSVHAVGKGTVTITISAPATENYYAASYNYTLTVSKRADLPFSFSGGRSDIATTDGMSQDGLGTDYSSAPKLKFDNTDDEVVINFTGEAGVLQYNIKGNSYGATSIFSVMESANGTDYTAVKTYTGTQLPTTSASVESCPLSSDTRFVKFVYTSKASGNVALGNIKIFAGHVRNVETGDYGTICLPYAVTAPVGATFYTVSNINNETGSITLSEAVSSLEAGTPYIFQATKDDVVCEYTGDAVAEPVDDTYLTGVFVATPAPADSYVLQNQSGVVGFYQVGSIVPTVGAYRAYLTVPGSNARVLTFGDETAISNIKVENNSNNVIYNMAGQRVNKAEKGIFIINGKKVIK